MLGAGSGTLGPVTDDTTSEPDLEQLVGDWLTVPEIAERLHVPLSRVRGMLADRELIGARVGPNKAVKVPARFVGAEGPLPELRGTFTVLADGGMSDEESLRWLHTPDPTLPVGDSPIDALLAGHKTEVRRRAMELAF